MKQRMRSAWQLWRGQARTAKLCLALAGDHPRAPPHPAADGGGVPRYPNDGGGANRTGGDPARTGPNRAAGRHAACRCFDLARHRAHHVPFRLPDHLRWGRFSSGLGHRRSPGDAHCGGGRGTSHLDRRKRLLWQPHPDRPRQRLRHLLRPLLGASGGGGGLGGAGADHCLGRFNGPLHRPPLPF